MSSSLEVTSFRREKFVERYRWEKCSIRRFDRHHLYSFFLLLLFLFPTCVHAHRRSIRSKPIRPNGSASYSYPLVSFSSADAFDHLDANSRYLPYTYVLHSPPEHSNSIKHTLFPGTKSNNCCSTALPVRARASSPVREEIHHRFRFESCSHYVWGSKTSTSTQHLVGKKHKHTRQIRASYSASTRITP